MYKILPYTKKQAKLLNVKVYPSIKPKYKIDIYDLNNNYITSIGSLGYKDYPTYIKDYGQEYAEKRRVLYKKRHQKDRLINGSRGYYSDKLLW